jgi:predicted PhzF superfamily epimerase YddE/YHI9
LAEVPFCGHATIAAGVALADRGLAAPPETDGEQSRIVLTTNGGPVAVATALDEGGRIRATLTTVSTWVREPEPGVVAAVMALLGWRDGLFLMLAWALITFAMASSRRCCGVPEGHGARVATSRTAG